MNDQYDEGYTHGAEDESRLFRGKVAQLEKENKRLREALERVIQELGVPQPGYPAPVGNAYDIAKQALGESEDE